MQAQHHLGEAFDERSGTVDVCVVGVRSEEAEDTAEKFLERMEGLVPWSELEGGDSSALSEGGRDRLPYALSLMLRVHCMQLFYNPSDSGMEDMLHEVESVRQFAGLGCRQLPDETTILNFRHCWRGTASGRRCCRRSTRACASRLSPGPE